MSADSNSLPSVSVQLPLANSAVVKKTSISFKAKELGFVDAVSFAVTFHCGCPSMNTWSPSGLPSIHPLAANIKKHASHEFKDHKFNARVNTCQVFGEVKVKLWMRSMDLKSHNLW